MNLVLIGYRGTGKSTVARRLSLLLGWDPVDADEQIERRAARSIAEIFRDQGEPHFRQLEAEELERLARGERQIIASGGGVVLRPENRALLGRMGRVVWLRARPETIVARLAADASTAARRPPLTSAAGMDEVVQLLAQRSPWYEECADLVVDTDDKSPAEIATEIVSGLALAPDPARST